ncbi:GTP-binding protein [Nocardioides sp.]|uniref:GTP-binding protein n=1 Tax=Nocardioides sp. TaxID=35761 RepID=UPI0026392C7C|nr:GTP-binding protein [Nocardioides sp.]
MHHAIHAADRTAVVLISGFDDGAMGAAAIAVHLGVPGAVAVRHTIDPERQVLTRIVSDLSGVLEREEINLAHACVSCAIREDIVPTLERLAAAGRWSAIVACLPVAAEATQVCRVVAFAPQQAPHVRIAAVVTALDGAGVVRDLLGDDLLDERGLATSREDRRGVGEVGCSMVEYADLVCLTSVPDPAARALLAALARPGVSVVTDPAAIDVAPLLVGAHRPEEVESWVSEVRREPLPPAPEGVWRLDLRSDRPFHPLRFADELVTLGSGPRRSRGCFWLPTRPDAVCAWDGAGGQIGIGAGQLWGRRPPLTRITVLGLDADAAARPAIRAAFEASLVTEAELAARGRVWVETWDGFEPWLGPIQSVA